MKTWKVTIEFVGLCGIYPAVYLIKARTEKSAQKKAYSVIGDRSYNSLKIEGA